MRQLDEATALLFAEQGIELPPTEDELPYSDGIPMETHRHALQMALLIEPLRLAWGNRDAFVAGDMFVYFSPDQVRTHDFRGPDVFIVLDVSPRDRKSWVTWDEGKAPDVVIELLSATTAEQDKTVKKQIYQDRLRVPEYFWFDPYSGELAGFALLDAQYHPIEPDSLGRLRSDRLKLLLTHWDGEYAQVSARWLRWARPDGALLPSPQETVEYERRRADEAQQQAEEAQQQVERERQRVVELEAQLARYQQQFGDPPRQ